MSSRWLPRRKYFIDYDYISQLFRRHTTAPGLHRIIGTKYPPTFKPSTPAFPLACREIPKHHLAGSGPLHGRFGESHSHTHHGIVRLGANDFSPALERHPAYRPVNLHRQAYALAGCACALRPKEHAGCAHVASHTRSVVQKHGKRCMNPLVFSFVGSQCNPTPQNPGASRGKSEGDYTQARRHA